MTLNDGAVVRGIRPDEDAQRRADARQAERAFLTTLGGLHLRRHNALGTSLRDVPPDLQAAVNDLEAAERDIGVRHVRLVPRTRPHNTNSAESERGRAAQ